VNEDCSLKDSGVAGKPSSRFGDKKLQMRGILVTPTTPILDGWFRSMRNRVHLVAPQVRRPWLASVEGPFGSLKQAEG
jgi:hypothetical protein